MKMTARMCALVVFALVAASANAQERRPPTIDDLLNLVQVSSAEISPDGRQVIYSKSEIKKWSDNKRVSSIWIANADGTAHRQLLGSDKDRSPSWSPDGRSVAFLSTRDQAENARDAAGAQIWLLPMTAGGEATKLTDHKTAIRALKWSDDSTQIFFTAEEEDPLKDIRKNSLGDGIFVDEGPNGQGRGSFTNLWVMTVADKQSRRLTTGDNFIGDFEPSPDAKRVAYTRRPNNQRNQQNLSEVFIVSVDAAVPTQLTRNEAPENNLAWAPDGRAITYIAPSDKTWELAQGNLYIHPIEGGGSPTVLSGNGLCHLVGA
jgi:dipeptidyl aminopeptidase/acylaminoacyl peptidase